jgi:nucleotide-binding universal stress UspA family protein
MKKGMAMFQKILVAYDGSKAANHAFRTAMELAKPLAASLIILAVAQLPEPATMVETSAMLESAKEHYEKEFKHLRTRAKAVGVDLHTRVAVGHAAEQILHQAVELKVDLIIMGHRGGSRVKEWLLGSVSKRVITYAPCSVLVVR